ncbi:hypothetical protein Hanom_Chr06g00497561 [Helianthus anomalus]
MPDLIQKNLLLCVAIYTMIVTRLFPRLCYVIKPRMIRFSAPQRARVLNLVYFIQYTFLFCLLSNF